MKAKMLWGRIGTIIRKKTNATNQNPIHTIMQIRIMSANKSDEKARLYSFHHGRVWCLAGRQDEIWIYQENTE